VHIFGFYLNCKIGFKSSRLNWRFGLKYLRFDLKKNSNRGTSAVCLPTQNRVHKSSKNFCFRCRLIPTQHSTNWLIDTLYRVWLCLKYTTVHHIPQSLRFIENLLYIYFHERHENWVWNWVEICPSPGSSGGADWANERLVYAACEW